MLAAKEYTSTCTGYDTIIVHYGSYVDTINSGKVNHQDFTGQIVPFDSAAGVGRVETDLRPGSKGTEIGMYDGSPIDNGSDSPPSGMLTREAVGVVIFSVVANKNLLSTDPKLVTKGADNLPGISTDDMDQLFLHGGESGTVAAGRQTSSGSRKVLLEFFGKTETNGPAPSKTTCTPTTTSGFCTADSTLNLLDFVNSTPDAIGYVTLAAVPNSDQTAYPNITGYPNVTQLQINGVSATASTLIIGSYSYAGVEHFYLQPNPSDLEKYFSDYLITQYVPANQNYIIPCSSVPKRFGSDC